MVNDVIPPVDIRKIKTYITQATYITQNMQELVYNLKLDQDTKVFLFAQTISELKNYERIFRSNGYTTLALWNSTRYQDDEHKYKLTPYQLEARQRLLDESSSEKKQAKKKGIDLTKMFEEMKKNDFKPTTLEHPEYYEMSEDEIEEIRDGILSDNMIFVTKDTTDRRVVFIFGKDKALLSIVRQIIPNRFFKYDGSGIPQKNCYNLYSKCYKNRNYTISL